MRSGSEIVRIVLATAATVLGSAACGPVLQENDDLPSGPWRVEAVELDGTTVGPGGRSMVLEFSTAESALRGNTGCHQIFGAFTFLDDGTASFTIPGRSSEACAPADQTAEDQLIDALEAVSSWTLAPDRSLEVRGPTASVTLTSEG